MNPAIPILDLALNAIANNDPDQVTTQLSLLMLNHLDEAESAALLNRCLVTAAVHQADQVVVPILEAWNDGITNYENVSLFSTLFLYPQLSVQGLTYAAKVLVDVSFLEVIDELTHLDSNDNTMAACYKALAVFGPQSRDTIEVALINAGGTLSADDGPVNQDNVNQAVIEFLEYQLSKLPVMAPKPDWVNNFEPEVPSEDIIFELQPPQIEVPTLSLDQQLDLLLDGLDASGLDLTDRERAREAIIAILNTSTPEQRQQLIYPVIESQTLDSLQSDQRLFRLLGPANPLLNSTPEELAFGGCRMFSCAVFDYDSEDLVYYDWFTGICDQCHRGIERRQWALRMPVAPGGWAGIYCSFDCLRKGVDQLEEDRRRPELAIRIMIDNIEHQIRTIGIQDLIPSQRRIEPYQRPGSGLSPQTYQFAS